MHAIHKKLLEILLEDGALLKTETGYTEGKRISVPRMFSVLKEGYGFRLNDTEAKTVKLDGYTLEEGEVESVYVKMEEASLSVVLFLTDKGYRKYSVPVLCGEHAKSELFLFDASIMELAKIVDVEKLELESRAERRRGR